MKDQIERITISIFVRHVGPGVVLFALVMVSSLKPFGPVDVSEWTLWPVFLVAGVLGHRVYRTAVYEPGILRLKDWKKRKNYRDLIKKEYQRMKTNGLIEEQKAKPEMSSSDAEWVWREIKREFGVVYSPTVQLWASSVHLLYFTGICTFLFGLLEFGHFGCNLAMRKCLETGWLWAGGLGLILGAAGFSAALLSDIAFERVDTYNYESIKAKSELQKFLERVFNSTSFSEKT